MGLFRNNKGAAGIRRRDTRNNKGAAGIRRRETRGNKARGTAGNTAGVSARTITALNVDGVPVQIRHKNVRRINLRVHEDGTVAISVPVGTPDKVALDFLKEKWAWVQNARNRQAGRRSEGKTVREYSEADRRLLKARVERILPEIEARTGLHCSGWTVRKMTSRWGSCNTGTHHINLSLMLVDQSDEALEYVIVHELVHTRVSNHGPEFKAYMDELMPGWRAIRKTM